MVHLEDVKGGRVETLVVLSLLMGTPPLQACVDSHACNGEIVFEVVCGATQGDLLKLINDIVLLEVVLDDFVEQELVFILGPLTSALWHAKDFKSVENRWSTCLRGETVRSNDVFWGLVLVSGQEDVVSSLLWLHLSVVCRVRRDYVRTEQLNLLNASILKLDLLQEVAVGEF